jgi:hypothetical protein
MVSNVILPCSTKDKAQKTRNEEQNIKAKKKKAGVPYVFAPLVG